ncbi:hypothetical protein Pcinc_007400 [Petrolisthes cinctipes]|nr:hypothetical protein Pcinc_007400 [Petrolisthes cinctipes]
MKALVYADSKEDFRDKWENFQASSLTMTYPNFLRYLSSLVQRKEEWAVAFRDGAVLRGHHTNNFCHATMSIIKEFVLKRCKAYNTAQLVVSVADIFDYYMRQRLVDVALKRRRVKVVNVGKSRHWLAVLAKGEEKAPKEAFFTDLSVTENKDEIRVSSEEIPVSSEEIPVLSEEISVSTEELKTEVEVKTEDMDTTNENEYASEHHQEAVIAAKIQEATEAIQRAGARFGNKDSIQALDRFIQRMNSVHSTTQLNSELFGTSSALFLIRLETGNLVNNAEILKSQG